MHTLHCFFSYACPSRDPTYNCQVLCSSLLLIIAAIVIQSVLAPLLIVLHESASCILVPLHRRSKRLILKSPVNSFLLRACSVRPVRRHTTAAALKLDLKFAGDYLMRDNFRVDFQVILMKMLDLHGKSH